MRRRYGRPLAAPRAEHELVLRFHANGALDIYARSEDPQALRRRFARLVSFFVENPRALACAAGACGTDTVNGRTFRVAPPRRRMRAGDPGGG